MKTVLIWAQLIAFFGWNLLLISFPLAILWGIPGLCIGLALGTAILATLRINALKRLSRELSLQQLSSLDAPPVFELLNSIANRVGSHTPRLFVVDSPAINAAIIGFRSSDDILVLTRGALALNRKTLAALLTRVLVRLSFQSPAPQTWLSAYLLMLEQLLKFPKRHKSSTSIVLSSLFKLLLYPVTALPFWLLRPQPITKKEDSLCLKLLGEPALLPELLRQIEVSHQRMNFRVSLSLRHLFIYWPEVDMPVLKMFLNPTSLTERIQLLQNETLLRGR